MPFFFRSFLVLLLAAGGLSAQTTGPAVAEAAASQIGKTTRYDPSYQRLNYPMGDVPEESGVCSDVVIRALRSVGIDLQQRVHEDMKTHFSAYPQNWGLKKTDRNIDHRRVPNLETYFKRCGFSLPVTKDPGSYQPGDIVSVRLDNGLPHIMVVSGRKNPEGVPLIIHNIGAGTCLEDRLFSFRITGHYRIKKTTP